MQVKIIEIFNWQYEWEVYAVYSIDFDSEKARIRTWDDYTGGDKDAGVDEWIRKTRVTGFTILKN